MSSARLWRKLISCAKILAIMESVQKFANCKKLQIICEESAQNAFGFVNQEPSRFSYLTKQFLTTGSLGLPKLFSVKISDISAHFIFRKINGRTRNVSRLNFMS